jgi:hypothetical protein
MHSNPGLLPLQRSASNEDYRYGKKEFFSPTHSHFVFSDYFTASRGRPPSTSGLPPGYDIPGKIHSLFFILLNYCFCRSCESFNESTSANIRWL